MATRLRNSTDITDETLRAIVNAVKPPDIGRFDVEVRNSADWAAGYAYTHGSRLHATKNPFITMRLPRTEKFGRTTRKPHGAYLCYATGGRAEATVALTAHELRHLWQKRHPKGGRVWGARGQFSERDADAYALRMLRKFRRGELAIEWKTREHKSKTSRPKG